MSVPLWRRWRRFRRSRCRKLCPAVLAVVMLCVLVGKGVESSLYPVLRTMAVSDGVNRVSQAVSSTAAECFAEYPGIFLPTGDNDGDVLLLTGDSVAENTLKAALVNALIRALGELRTEDFGIPIGSLTGWMALSGKGPKVRVKLLSVGDVRVEMRHTFETAGINQTAHRVYADVTAVVYMMIPGEIFPAESSTSICIAEAVVIGSVPETYLQIGNGEQ